MTEDIKLKRKPKFDEMTKEQIREAIIRKRECNAKAQNIVETLLERHISEKFFLQCLPNINQIHFDDIIEERSIIQICGYPLCSNALSTKDIPKQTYRISLKTNKVYDITARKRFCSNSCYKSATHIKKQLLTSPLWFREYEEIPIFNLLPLDSVGALGQEIDVAIVEKIKTSTPFTSVKDFAKVSLDQIDNYSSKHKGVSEDVKKKNDIHNEKEDNAKQEININIDKDTAIAKAPCESGLKLKQASTSALAVKKNPTKNPLNIVGDIIEKPEKEIDTILQTMHDEANTSKANEKLKPTLVKKKQPLVIMLSIEVEKCLAEWFTIDTLLLLCGEDKVKEMITDKGECIREYLNNYPKRVLHNSNNYDQYQALCRKLNMLELEDKRFDTQAVQRETKPLPDYSILQEESKKMELKVKAFLAGSTDIPDSLNDEQKQPEIEEDTHVTQLPLVDKNAQNALRRRIVLEHLNKVLPDILKSLGLLSLSISSDVRLLVNTFELKANNIMFKPIQWTLIAIIVIKLLSLRDKRLEYLLEQPTAFQHLQLLLLSYKQDGGYLDRLILWLTDIDRLLDTNDTQLTVE